MSQTPGLTPFDASKSTPPSIGKIEADRKTSDSMSTGIVAHAPATPTESQSRSSISSVASSTLTNTSESSKTTKKEINATRTLTNPTRWERICRFISEIFSRCLCCFRSSAKVAPAMTELPKLTKSIEFQGAKLDLAGKIKESVNSSLKDSSRQVGKDYELPSVCYYDLKRCEHLEISVKGKDSIATFPQDSEMIVLRDEVSKNLGERGKTIYDNLIVTLSQASSADTRPVLLQHYEPNTYNVANIGTRDLDPENNNRATQFRRINIDDQNVNAINLQLFKVDNTPSGNDLEKRYLVIVDRTSIPRAIMSSDKIGEADFSQAKRSTEITKTFASEKEALDYMDSALLQFRRQSK